MKQQMPFLAMTHCTTERGGSRTEAQKRRISRKRALWQPEPGALSESIRLLVNELGRFASPEGVHIDTDEHPLYAPVLATDLAMRWGEMPARRCTACGSLPGTTTRDAVRFAG